MEGQFESWVTLATNDTSAWTALVLAKSLRRTTTGRKLTLIITDQVSSELKHVLAKEFDFVEKVDEKDLQIWNCPSQLLKLWSWNLKVWNKCVFVDPNIIVLHNCDELFEHVEFSAVPKSDHAGEFDSSLFVLKPKRSTFDELLKNVHQKGGINANETDVLQTHFKKWANTTNLHLDAELYSLNKSNRNEVVVKLAKFDHEPWKGLDGNEHSLEKLWLKVYTQDVLTPILKEEKAALKSWLLNSLASTGLPVEIPVNLINERIHSPPPAELMDSVAVIGMSCRFPGSNSAAEYWDFLCSGQDGITHYPADRPRSRTYITDEYYDLVKAGFLKCSIDEFDCKFFGLSPREAELMDPQQRILLEVAWESFEAAGINPHSLKGNSKTGVYVGIWQQEYDRMFVPVLYPMHYKQLGNSYGATASRISYFLGLLGPNVAVESGCSSSLAALHLACESLRRGESNLGVAAGVNIFQIMPLPAENKTLAPDFHCKTFDEGANGFGRGEGCGVLILKRFADAWADGDNILAAIRGSAVNNDGASNSFGTPFSPGQMSAAKAALARAKVDPLEVSYVECHGTGTAVGDPIEFHGLSQVYGVGPRPRPMFLSSVKTNIGHAESAAGIAGVIKVILAMQAKALPPHLNLKRVNPKINLNLIPAHIPTEVTEWISPERPLRVAAVSAFSLSGNNAHMILQEVPKRAATVEVNEYATQVITLSAKSEEALSALREKYVQFGKKNPSLNLADLAFTANCGRAHFPHRSAITVAGTTASDFGAKLESGSFDSSIIDPKANKPRIGFLFTGQGSQYAGMAWDLYKSSAVFRSAFYDCDKLFKARLGVGLEETWKSSELLAQTLYSQPSIFCLQVCLLKVWASLGVKPDVVLGHSVGEFAAVVAAGILSLESAMDLILSRSLLIHKLVSPGAMLAVKQSHAKVNGIIAKVINNNSTAWIDVAAINSPEETVVSGTPEAIKIFEKACEAEGVKTTVLTAAAHAFHSRAMDAILKDYGEIAGKLKYQKSQQARYVSGLKAGVVNVSEFNPAYWQHHVRDPVKFSESIPIVCKEVDVLIEIGPHPVLLPLAMNSPGSAQHLVYCPTLRRTEENSATMSASLSKLYLAGVEISWNYWHREGRNKVPHLPLYPFQRQGQKFWFREGEESHTGNFGKSLHPILGSKIPSPHSGTTTTFHNTLQLTKLGYVEDHAVGGRVIFPAAGYLETILAAGVHTILGSASAAAPAGSLPALCVSNFSIQAALELCKPTEIQTILSKDSESTKINIYRQIGAQTADKWKSHAEASFQFYQSQNIAFLT